MLYPLIRKFFFSLDAETAHGIGMMGVDRVACLMELDPKYASAIVIRYALLCGGTSGIFVIRNGEKLPCDAVYRLSDEDLQFKDGSVNDAQKGKKDDE